MDDKYNEKVMQGGKSKGSGSCCSVASCKNTGRVKYTTRPNIKFHRFPKDPEMRREWVRKCGRKDRFNPDNGTICSDHFIPEDYQRDLRAELLGLGDDKKKLLPDSVPHRNLPPEIQKKIRKRRDRELTEGEKIANRKKLVAEAIEWAESLPPKSPEYIVTDSAIQNITINSTTALTEGIKSNSELNNSQSQINTTVHQKDSTATHSPELSKESRVIASESISSRLTESLEIIGAEMAPESAITIDFVDPLSSSPANSQEDDSTWDRNTYKMKYSELLSNHEELDAKFKRCYKVLCCFKIAYTKLRSQNNTAKTKIIDLRHRNKDLQRQLKQKSEKKSQKQNKLTQTDTNPFEDDVTGWW